MNGNTLRIAPALALILVAGLAGAAAAQDGSPLASWCRDADGDGFGSPYDRVDATAQPPGYISDCSDCDDRFAFINPGQPEICDGLDNDCDGTVDQLWPQVGTPCFVGVGTCRGVGVYVCTIDGLGVECGAGPGLSGEEICDCLDNDCDGEIDEGCTSDAREGLRSMGFELELNAPNPFNPLTTIRFHLPSEERVYLRIHDLSGRLIRTLLAGEYLPGGQHRVTWDGRDGESREVASGVYFYSLEVGGRTDTRRMALIR